MLHLASLLTYNLLMFRPRGQSLFEVAWIVKMRNQRDFKPIVKLIFPPNTMFLQGNETTKSSISLSFCLAMASPFALNYHNGVKKLMKSHLNFYPLAVSKRNARSAAIVSKILIAIKTGIL